MNPAGVVTVGFLTSPSSEARFCGRTVRPDQLILCQSNREHEIVSATRCSMHWLSICEETWKRCACVRWGPASSELPPYGRLSLRHAVDREGLIRISTWLRFVLASWPDVADPAIAGYIEDEIVDLVLTRARPEKNRAEATLPRRHRALQRAVAFLAAHHAEPVSLQQVCEAVGTSQRPLELAFKECFDLTPKAYINLRRLHGAPRDLRSVAPGDTSVTEIATRWGFFHLGRFSAQYRKHFGESPRKTLVRRSHPERLISLGAKVSVRARDSDDKGLVEQIFNSPRDLAAKGQSLAEKKLEIAAEGPECEVVLPGMGKGAAIAGVDSPTAVAEIHLASLLAIDVDNVKERAYLDELARQLRIPEDLALEMETRAKNAG